MRISLSVGLTQFHQQGGGAVSNWILATGFWDDSGLWLDSDVWID